MGKDVKLNYDVTKDNRETLEAIKEHISEASEEEWNEDIVTFIKSLNKDLIKCYDRNDTYNTIWSNICHLRKFIWNDNEESWEKREYSKKEILEELKQHLPFIIDAELAVNMEPQLDAELAVNLEQQLDTELAVNMEPQFEAVDMKQQNLKQRNLKKQNLIKRNCIRLMYNHSNSLLKLHKVVIKHRDLATLSKIIAVIDNLKKYKCELSDESDYRITLLHVLQLIGEYTTEKYLSTEAKSLINVKHIPFKSFNRDRICHYEWGNFASGESIDEAFTSLTCNTKLNDAYNEIMLLQKAFQMMNHWISQGMCDSEIIKTNIDYLKKQNERYIFFIGHPDHRAYMKQLIEKCSTNNENRKDARNHFRYFMCDYNSISKLIDLVSLEKPSKSVKLNLKNANQVKAVCNLCVKFHNEIKQHSDSDSKRYILEYKVGMLAKLFCLLPIKLFTGTELELNFPISRDKMKIVRNTILHGRCTEEVEELPKDTLTELPERTLTEPTENTLKNLTKITLNEFENYVELLEKLDDIKKYR